MHTRFKPSIGVRNNARGKARWPDWFVRPVVEWIASRAKIDHDFQVHIKNPSRVSRIRGRAELGGHYCNITHHRRANREDWIDHRFTWSPSYVVNGPIESVVFLLAHEIFHLSSEGRRAFHVHNKPSQSGGEFRTNEWAYGTLKAFRSEWPRMRVRIIDKIRRERVTAKRRVEREQQHLAIKKTTAYKRSQAEAALARWESKRRRCDTFIVKYKRKLRALAAAETRAARKAAS